MFVKLWSENVMFWGCGPLRNALYTSIWVVFADFSEIKNSIKNQHRHWLESIKNHAQVRPKSDHESRIWKLDTGIWKSSWKMEKVIWKLWTQSQKMDTGSRRGGRVLPRRCHVPDFRRPHVTKPGEAQGPIY